MKYNAMTTAEAEKIARDVIAHNFESWNQASNWLCEIGATREEWIIAKAAFINGESILPFEIKTYYRIGEPRFDDVECVYRPSYNYADEKPELGVSVVNEKWLESAKSIFFGTSNEKLRQRGIWEIRGFAIGFGGDGEPVIYPVDYAVKTKFFSRKKLEQLAVAEG